MEGAHKQGSLASALFWLTLALVLAGVWADVLGWSVRFLPEDVSILPNGINRAASLWGRLCTGIVLVIFARHIPAVQNMLGRTVALLMCFATAIIVISYHQTLFDPLICSTIGAFFAGGGYVFLMSLIYIYFAKKIPATLIILCVAFSLFGKVPLSIAIGLYCTQLVQVGIVIASPLLVYLCYFLASFSIRDLASIETSTKVKGQAKNLLLVETVVFSALIVLTRALITREIGRRGHTDFSGMMGLEATELFVIFAFALLFTYLVFILPRKRFSLHVRCVFGFVVLLTGLQILALTSDFQIHPVFETLAAATGLFSHLVFWLIVINCIRQTETEPWRITSLAHLVYALVSLIWIHFFERAAFITSTFVMIVFYVLLLLLIVFLLSERFSTALFSRSRLKDSAHERYLAFAQHKGLSNRESQVFELLAEGKKRGEIEQALNLSEGTVKTHITHIYRKLEVYSKKEMLSALKKYSSHEALPHAQDAVADKTPLSINGQALQTHDNNPDE